MNYIDIIRNKHDNLIITYTTIKVGNKTYNVKITENTPSETALKNFTRELLRLL